MVEDDLRYPESTSTSLAGSKRDKSSQADRGELQPLKQLLSRANGSLAESLAAKDENIALRDPFRLFKC
jgi:hypothetical protein